MARKNSNREKNTAPFPAFENQARAPTTQPLTPFKRLLKRLSEAYGPSGSEEGVRELVRDEIKQLADQVRVDAFGNLIAQRRGSGSRRKKIMLSAHLDEIGVMVSFIDTRGYARFGTLGAVKPLTLLGARVQFENGAVGIIGRQAQGAARTEIDMEALFIDVSGAPTAIQVGDSACFAREFLEAGDFLIGKALGARAGCAILIETMRRLKKSPHDIFCVFTVQQQVGARGAGAAAFAIQPDVAFVLDAASASDMPGAPAQGIALGKGPAIKFQDEGALTSARAREMLLEAARQTRVPYQLDVTPRAMGDTLPIQAAREGVPTAALALPMRYLNTASEMAHSRDAQDAIELCVMLLQRPV